MVAEAGLGLAANRGDLDSDTMLRVLAEAARTVREELTDVPLPVEGELPAQLSGVLFRNGPGRFERGGARSMPIHSMGMDISSVWI